VVSGDLNDDSPVVEQPDTTNAATDSGSAPITSISDDGSSPTPADDPLPARPESPEVAEEDLVVAEDKPEPPSADPAPPPPVAPIVTGEVPADLMDAIMADAGSRIAAKTALAVIRAQAVTWSDGSLGCAEKGMTYTQALVDGYWVVLDAGGQQLDYRASRSGAFRYCAVGGLPPIDPGDK
jgi:hypothetical protein